MKNLDRERRSTGESAVWSELKMKEIQNPRNLCKVKYLILKTGTSQLAVRVLILWLVGKSE